MPSKQLSFFLMPYELKKLGDFINNEMKGFFIYNAMSSEKLNIVYDINSIPYLGTSLTSDNFLKDIKVEKLKDGLYSINTTAPLIEFSPGLYRKHEKILKPGRILVKSGFYDDNGQWINHPENFIQWSDMLFTWIKKTYKPSTFTKYKGFRISKEVVDWVNNEKGIFEYP